MADKVLIVGSKNEGLELTKALASKGMQKVIVVGVPKEKENTIIINGSVYREKQAKQNRFSPMLRKVVLMASVFASLDPGFKEPKKINVDIVEEMKLIACKKSKLPRAQREYVEQEFNKKYEYLYHLSET